MPFDFFINSVSVGANPFPNEQYRNDEQALIDDQWINSTAVEEIEEQDFEDGNFDSFTFHPIEAWLNTIVGLSTTGRKEAWEFVQLIFQDLKHPRIEGRYYRFHGYYWLEYNDDRTSSVISHASVRRCNNYLKIRDPENNGEVYTIPCIVGYDMASPSSRVTNDIITPNNHATVMVQRNNITSRLFKTNARFILSGRPFKLYGYQNATEQFPDAPNDSSMMYLDMYLDEIWEQDNLVEGIAYNGVDYVEPIEDGLVLTPNPTIIREGGTETYTVSVKENGITYDAIIQNIIVPAGFLSITYREKDKFRLYCKKRSKDPVEIEVRVISTELSKTFIKRFEIKLTSMIG